MYLQQNLNILFFTWITWNFEFEGKCEKLENLEFDDSQVIKNKILKVVTYKASVLIM